MPIHEKSKCLDSFLSSIQAGYRTEKELVILTDHFYWDMDEGTATELVNFPLALGVIISWGKVSSVLIVLHFTLLPWAVGQKLLIALFGTWRLAASLWGWTEPKQCRSMFAQWSFSSIPMLTSGEQAQHESPSTLEPTLGASAILGASVTHTLITTQLYHYCDIS